MPSGQLQLCLLLVALSLGIAQAQPCLSVNDILPQVPKDLQELIKKRMDVFNFKGTFFVPTEDAWRNKDFDEKLYGKSLLSTILDFGIVPGVRLAGRPRADLNNGTLQLDTKYKDDPTLVCLAGDRPDAQLEVDILVTGNPSLNGSTSSVAGTPGNTFKAGDGEITILKVYGDKVKQLAMINAKNVTSKKDAHRDMDKDEFEKNLNATLHKISSWDPANVVKVVQCTNADIYFVDKVVTPCPMCGKKCAAVIVDKIVMVVLPITTVFAVALAIAGYVAICCGCNLCASASGVCGCFWKCVCRSLVLIVVLLELLFLSSFIGFAYYLAKFEEENKDVPGVKKWQPYFIWSVVGAVVTGLVVISQVWYFFSQARKRNEHKRHKQFHTQPPPPMYQPVGAVGPMRA